MRTVRTHRDIRGIDAWLTSLTWETTYGDALEGSPEMLTRIVLANLAPAKLGRVVIGHCNAEGSPWRELPPERCFARWRSTWARPDHDDDVWGSFLELGPRTSPRLFRPGRATRRPLANARDLGCLQAERLEKVLVALRRYSLELYVPAVHRGVVKAGGA
jgi:hypothetical protein